VKGHNVSEDAVRRAVELSETKYCPAQAMLKQVFPMELVVTIQEAEG
jgi:putative redox protein